MEIVFVIKILHLFLEFVSGVFPLVQVVQDQSATV